MAVPRRYPADIAGRGIVSTGGSRCESRASFFAATIRRASSATAQHAPGIAAHTKSHGMGSFIPMSTPPITGPRIDPMRPMPSAQPAPDERTNVG